MEKKKIIHDYYLCDIDPDEGSGYWVKQVNWKGQVVSIHPAPFEALDWFQDKDFVRVSREEWEKIGTESE